jgi:DNA helicase-2/ATP-dependent DNA helicase PcrA
MRNEGKDELEEERRLTFVGMTRAKQELYLCYSRLREFRGQTLYAVPSSFLRELPADGVEGIDVTAGGGKSRAAEEWRGGGGAAAEQGWIDAGVLLSKKSEPAPGSETGGSGYAEGMLVKHDMYGVGRITSVSGFGALRRLKVRFSAHGEKTFIADRVKLEIVRKG